MSNQNINLCYMMDISRNSIPNKSFLKDFICTLEKIGYNQLMLYMEDTYEVIDEPYFGYFRGALKIKDIQEIDDFALKHGITLIPAIQVFGHLKTIFKWDKYKEILDYGDCLLANYDKTYELIENMFKTVKKAFKTNLINIGMDETYASGRGRYLDIIGYEPHRDIYLKHLKKISELVDKYGFKAMMWGDMFISNDNNHRYLQKDPKLSKETIALKPKNINAIYWDYYIWEKDTLTGMAKAFKKLDEHFIFAGGNWSWRGYVPRNDTSINQSKNAIQVMKKFGCTNFILTSWGDDGHECPCLSTLPATFAFKEFANGNFNMSSIKSKFKELFNISFDAFRSLDDLNNIGDKYDNARFNRNPSKYMLYSDVLGSHLDYTVDFEKTKKFELAYKKYKKYILNKDFGYIFDLEYHLGRVLKIKYPMGLKLRIAYQNNDLDTLKSYIPELIKLEKELLVFYDKVKIFWEKENTLNGFEIIDTRLGGLCMRVKNAKKIIEDYCDGKIESIPSLEGELLAINNINRGNELTESRYEYMVSSNRINF